MADARAAPALPPLLDHVQTRLRRLPRQGRSRAKVAALLAAAERLFVERGYEAVTADAIAAAAGVSTGTFYSYFGDKRDALILLLAERIDEILGAAGAPFIPRAAEEDASPTSQAGGEVQPAPPQVRTVEMEERPPPATVALPSVEPEGRSPRALIRAAVARAVTRGRDPRLQQLRRIWFAAARRDPELAAYERLAAEHAVASIRGRLEAIAALGEAQPLDVEATAWVIWTLVDALTVRLSLLGETMPPAERLVEATTELICRAVLVPPGQRRLTPLPIE